ncbi:hypothetical protein M758_10G143800 [Ceratodon purpureus]|nr:hypothetical protein M758_10G143800 [Ceratodon purpureus]
MPTYLLIITFLSIIKGVFLVELENHNAHDETIYFLPGFSWTVGIGMTQQCPLQ